jgi:hypothetical protein
MQKRYTRSEARPYVNKYLTKYSLGKQKYENVHDMA